MLVLTRKTNEVITIGDQITVRILRIHGIQVRVGKEAQHYLVILLYLKHTPFTTVRSSNARAAPEDERSHHHRRPDHGPHPAHPGQPGARGHRGPAGSPYLARRADAAGKPRVGNPAT